MTCLDGARRTRGRNSRSIPLPQLSDPQPRGLELRKAGGRAEERTALLLGEILPSPNVCLISAPWGGEGGWRGRRSSAFVVVSKCGRQGQSASKHAHVYTITLFLFYLEPNTQAALCAFESAEVVSSTMLRPMHEKGNTEEGL